MARLAEARDTAKQRAEPGGLGEQSEIARPYLIRQKGQQKNPSLNAQAARQGPRRDVTGLLE
jgi:hypothetical protein